MAAETANRGGGKHKRKRKAGQPGNLPNLTRGDEGPKSFCCRESKFGQPSYSQLLVTCLLSWRRLRHPRLVAVAAAAAVTCASLAAVAATTAAATGTIGGMRCSGTPTSAWSCCFFSFFTSSNTACASHARAR